MNVLVTGTEKTLMGGSWGYSKGLKGGGVHLFGVCAIKKRNMVFILLVATKK